MQKPKAVPVPTPDAARTPRKLLLPTPTRQLGVLATPLPEGFVGHFDDHHYSRIQAIHENQARWRKDLDIGAVGHAASDHPLLGATLWDVMARQPVTVRAAYWRWSRGYYLTVILARLDGQLESHVAQTYTRHEVEVVGKAERFASRFRSEDPSKLLFPAASGQSI